MRSFIQPIFKIAMAACLSSRPCSVCIRFFLQKLFADGGYHRNTLKSGQPQFIDIKLLFYMELLLFAQDRLWNLNMPQAGFSGAIGAMPGK
jgi:hypothetical protein